MTTGLWLRSSIEDDESSRLAPFALPSRASAGRLHPEPNPAAPAFQLDRERVVNSRAFRRLAYKTQVFVNHEGDYYRTRLTHTMEAAQLARGVARALRLNEDLAETITLAHDLGHPPFGHAGERALAELMADHHGFEHNAQALRIVDLLERRYFSFRGLNLSFEVREGIWKRRDTPVARSMGYDGVFSRERGPLLEAQLADVVDGLAYDHHDLDDALKAGLLHPRELVDQLPQWAEAFQQVDELYRQAGPQADGAERVRRQEIIRLLRARQLDDLLETSRANLAEHGIKDLDDVRAHAQGNLITLSPAARSRQRELQRLLQTKVYRHYRVVRLVEKAKHFLRRLFEGFVSQPEQLPDEYQEWVRIAGLERAVCDYLAGMTDRYAQREYQKLFRPFEPM